MVFVRLGLTNTWRNMARSILTLISFAFAAGFLTFAISLSRGYASGTAAIFRGQLGGEMILYDRKIVPDYAQQEYVLSYHSLPFEMMTTIEHFFPEILNFGYLDNSSHTPFDTEFLQQLADNEYITAVYPRYQIPIWHNGYWGNQLRYLRGRDYTLDQNLVGHPQNYLIGGSRWFTSGESDFTCVVARVATSDSAADIPFVGKIITVEVPKIGYNGSSYLFDFTDPLQFELQIVGLLNLVIDEVTLSSGTVIPLEWKMEEIQVPLPVWQRIWTEASGGTDFIPAEVALQIADITYLEDIALELEPKTSDHTLISVPRLAEKALQQGHLANADLIITANIQFLSERLTYPDLPLEEREHLNSLIRELEWSLAATPLSSEIAPIENPQGLPADLRLPAVVLIFANSALVMAANLLIMVSDRKREIGILKAVGSRRIEIIQMVWAESALLSTMGSSAGFLVMRLPVVLNQIFAGAKDGYAAIFIRFLQDALLVYAASIGAALLFAILPALRLANLSVMEVTQSE